MCISLMFFYHWHGLHGLHLVRRALDPHPGVVTQHRPFLDRRSTIYPAVRLAFSLTSPAAVVIPRFARNLSRFLSPLYKDLLSFSIPHVSHKLLTQYSLNPLPPISPPPVPLSLSGTTFRWPLNDPLVPGMKRTASSHAPLTLSRSPVPSRSIPSLCLLPYTFANLTPAPLLNTAKARSKSASATWPPACPSCRSPSSAVWAPCAAPAPLVPPTRRRPLTRPSTPLLLTLSAAR